MDDVNKKSSYRFSSQSYKINIKKQQLLHSERISRKYHDIYDKERQTTVSRQRHRATPLDLSRPDHKDRTAHLGHQVHRAADTIYHTILNKRADGSHPGVQVGYMAMFDPAGSCHHLN